MVAVRTPEVPAATRPEQSRARYPDATGTVERDGGVVAWESYGSGDPPIVFVPPWQIVHSRVYKAQIPYFARRHRVIAWDNRGNGRSDRPLDPAVHTTFARAANLEAVMDAAGVQRAVLIGLSSASSPMIVFTSQRPERVLGVVFIGPASFFGQPNSRADVDFDAVLPDETGWNKENIHFWRRDFRGYLEYFFAEAFPEPHSTKQREDAVGYGLDTDVETLASTMRTPQTVDLETIKGWCAEMTTPALVIQGTNERISHLTQGIGLARAIPGARLELIEGAGHITNARDPIRVNLRIRDFLRTVEAGDARA